MRANKYRGNCRECRASVPRQAGYIEKQAGKWTVLCAPCAKPTPQPIAYLPDELPTAYERILNWCQQGANERLHAGMRELDGNHVVRDVAAWGDGRNENGTDNPNVIYARGESWETCEEALLERFPVPPPPPWQGRSRVTRFSSGAEIYTNVNGRCEDAPCCGCCS